MSEKILSKEKKKRISTGIMVAILIAALAVLYYLFPRMDSYRLSGQKDSKNLSMIVSPDGVLYRRNPIPEWQGAEIESGFPIGTGDIYYLYQYEHDPQHVFLHGVEYVWYGTTVEYYRDDFVFPSVVPENIGYMQGMLYINAEYSEVSEETMHSGSVYTGLIIDRTLIDRVFVLIDSSASRIPLDENEPLHELGRLDGICKTHPGLQYSLPVISYNGKEHFIVYETDKASGERLGYRVEIPPGLYSDIFGGIIEQSVQHDFLEDLLP